MAQTMDRAIALMAEGNRRKVEAARPLLNDRQLQLMKDSLDQALLKARAAASEARSSAAAPGR
jgi:hypothetical protein